MDNKKGFVFTLMICLAASRPQYNYQPVSTRLSAVLPNLSFNSGSVSSLPSSYSPAPTGVSSQLQMQIVPAKSVSQSYIPPTQQYLPPTQQYLPPTQQYIPPAQDYLPPLQSSGQSSFKDVSQLPLQTQSFHGSIPIAPSYNTPSQSLSGHLSNLNHQTALPAQRTIVTKDIYVHSAPQDIDDEYDFRRQLQSIPIRKNYRIIFIKAPTQNIRVAAEALRQAQAINEERTVIYVLTKKADVADLQRQLTQVQSTQTINRKPEVFFIKYKTNEEAQRAQKEIQAQYDALGGSTNVSDEGIAPLTSVVGSLGGDSLSSSGSGQLGSISSPSRTYLPPAKV